MFVENTVSCQIGTGLEKTGECVCLQRIPFPLLRVDRHQEIQDIFYRNSGSGVVLCLRFLRFPAWQVGIDVHKMPGSHEVVDGQDAKQAVEDGSPSDHPTDDDEHYFQQVNSRVLVVQRGVSILIDLPNDEGSCGRHPHKTEDDSQVSMLRTPVVQGVTDVATAIVNVQADDRERKN